MSLGTTIRNLDWIATLQLAAMRVFAGSIIFYLFQMWSDNAIYNPFIILALVILGLIILAPIAFLSGLIARAGVPFIGLLGLPFMLFTVLGDPFVWVLFQVKPDWVGVDRFGIFNPAFIFLFKGEAA